MNACLHASTHWEYHLPATLSGTIQTMETVWNSQLLHNMFTYYRCMILTAISQCPWDYVWTSYPTELTGEVLTITYSMFYNLSKYACCKTGKTPFMNPSLSLDGQSWNPNGKQFAFTGNGAGGQGAHVSMIAFLWNGIAKWSPLRITVTLVT